MLCIHIKYVFVVNSKKMKNLDLNKKSETKSHFSYNLPMFFVYSTVTDFAKFLGWSTLQPLITAI
jgi:hypothetical protein